MSILPSFLRHWLHFITRFLTLSNALNINSKQSKFWKDSTDLKMRELLKLGIHGRDIKIYKIVRRSDSFTTNSKEMLDSLPLIKPTLRFLIMILRIDLAILFGRKTRK